nr:unnamed protein product [Digitaria exilis]
MRRHLDHTFTPGHRQAWEQQPCAQGGLQLRRLILLACTCARQHFSSAGNLGCVTWIRPRQAATSVQRPGAGASGGQVSTVTAVCRPQLSRAAREPVAQAAQGLAGTAPRGRKGAA